MVSKAPRGEHGDVIRCHDEDRCLAMHEAAREVDSTYAAVVDAAHEFVRRVGKPGHRGGEIKIPVCMYDDLRAAVDDWKAAGQALHDASCKVAS